MPSAAVVPVRVRRLRQRGLASLIALGSLVPVACSDPVPRATVVPRAKTRGEGTSRPVAPEPPQPRGSNWILVRLRSFAVLPAAWHFADGSPDALVTIFAPLDPDPQNDLGQPRELAIVVPSAVPLHGIDFVVHTCEVQASLGEVGRADATFVRELLPSAHGHGGRRSPSLHLVLPQP